MLRQFPLTPGKVKIELSVIDTGKVSGKFTHRNLLLPVHAYRRVSVRTS